MCIMNKHFQDTRYYLKRAGQTVRAGLGEELEPVRARVASVRGEDADEELGRLDDVRGRMRDLQDGAWSRFERVRRPRTAR